MTGRDDDGDDDDDDDDDATGDDRNYHSAQRVNNDNENNHGWKTKLKTSFTTKRSQVSRWFASRLHRPTRIV